MDKIWDIYDPRIRLDLFFCVCDLFQENIKELRKLRYLDLFPVVQKMSAKHIQCLFKRPTNQNKTKSEEKSAREKLKTLWFLG